MECRNNNAGVKLKLLKMTADQQLGKMTSIEKIGYETLANHGLSFEPQKLMFNKFCVDAFIESNNMVVQFDGDYWHGNPEKYNELSPRQSKRAALDKSQDSYFAKAGVCVVRIWGSELKKDPSILIEKIEMALLQ
jgi:very-short-patch-repair endonuclease